MIITWEKNNDVLYYIIYKSDEYNIPSGYLSYPTCTCSSSFVDISSESDSFLYLEGVDSRLLPYLNPPDGFEYFGQTTDNYYDVPTGFYTVVAVSDKCASAYSSLVKAGDLQHQYKKTISFSVCNISLNPDDGFTNVRHPRWGLNVTQTDVSFNVSNACIISIGLYADIIDDEHLFFSQVINISSSGNYSDSYTISYDILPDIDVILVVKNISLSGSVDITNLSVTVSGYISDVPREILLDNIVYEEHVDRWSLSSPSSGFSQIGYYGGGGFLIKKAYKHPSETGSSCKIVISGGSSDYTMFLPIEEPVLVPTGYDVKIIGSGNPFVSTFHISENVEIDINNIINTNDVYFDGGTITSSLSLFTKVFYLDANIVYIDVWKYSSSITTLTISGPSGSVDIPITSEHVILPLDIDVNTGDEITFSADLPDGCLDIRFEYWRRALPECSCESNDNDEATYGTYEFEDVIMFDGVGGTRFRTYQINFDCDRIIISPYRGSLIGGEWLLTILEDGNPFRRFSSSSTSSIYDEEIDISFKANKSYTFIFDGSAASYSEGPPDVAVYLRGKTDGVLYLHGTVTSYDTIDKHIPSSHPDGSSDPWIESNFSYPFPIDLYAVGVTCDESDIGAWELHIPDYDIDISPSSYIELLDNITHIDPFTNINFKHKITGFPTVHLYNAVTTEFLDPSLRYYCMTVGSIFKSTEYSDGYIIPYDLSDYLEYIEFELSLSHPPTSDIQVSFQYSSSITGTWNNFLTSNPILYTGQTYLIVYRNHFSIRPDEIKYIKVRFPDGGWSEEASIFLNITLGTHL